MIASLLVGAVESESSFGLGLGFGFRFGSSGFDSGSTKGFQTYCFIFGGGGRSFTVDRSCRLNEYLGRFFLGVRVRGRGG